MKPAKKFLLDGHGTLVKNKLANLLELQRDIHLIMGILCRFTEAIRPLATEVPTHRDLEMMRRSVVD